MDSASGFCTNSRPMRQICNLQQRNMLLVRAVQLCTTRLAAAAHLMPHATGACKGFVSGSGQASWCGGREMRVANLLVDVGNGDGKLLAQDGLPGPLLGTLHQVQDHHRVAIPGRHVLQSSPHVTPPKVNCNGWKDQQADDFDCKVTAEQA